jgi:hypothetical protein
VKGWRKEQNRRRDKIPMGQGWQGARERSSREGYTRLHLFFGCEKFMFREQEDISKLNHLINSYYNNI